MAAPGVLANDTDTEGGPLTAALVTGTTGGNLTLDTDGSFTYTPNPGYHGLDFFTYQAVDPDGAASNTQSVMINVNAAPVATDDVYTTNEDTPVGRAAPGVLGNDTDWEDNPLTAALVTGPQHGDLAFKANGEFTYTSVYATCAWLGPASDPPASTVFSGPSWAAANLAHWHRGEPGAGPSDSHTPGSTWSPGDVHESTPRRARRAAFIRKFKIGRESWDRRQGLRR